MSAVGTEGGSPLPPGAGGDDRGSQGEGVPWIVGTGVDRAVLETILAPTGDVRLHDFVQPVLTALADAGHPAERSRAGLRSGRYILHSAYLNVTLARAPQGGVRASVVPAAEQLTLHPAGTLQEATRAALAIAGVFSAVSGTRAPPPRVHLVELTPYVDFAGHTLTEACLRLLPAVTTATCRLTCGERGSLAGLYGFGVDLYDKARDMRDNSQKAYLLDRYSAAGWDPACSPLWRFSPELKRRDLKAAEWPVDPGAVFRPALERFLRNATGLSRGGPRLDALLKSEPWNLLGQAVFPQLDAGAHLRPAVAEQSLHAALKQRAGCLLEALATLQALLPVQPDADPVIACQRVVEFLVGEDPAFLGRHAQKLAIALQRYPPARPGRSC